MHVDLADTQKVVVLVVTEMNEVANEFYHDEWIVHHKDGT